MARAIKEKCIDGIYRTDRQLCKWLDNLMELYELEPSDLTDEELDALRYYGCI